VIMTKSTENKESDMARSNQKFELGYQVLPFQKNDILDDAFPLLVQEGYKWYEGFIFHSLGHPVSRREQTYGNRDYLLLNDLDFIRQLASYSRAQDMYGLNTISLFICATFTNPTLWPIEFELIQVITKFLKGVGAPFLTLTGGPPVAGGFAAEKLHNNKEYEAFASALVKIGTFTQRSGIRTLFHPQIDCMVETIEELERFISILDTSIIGLCYDTAHIYAMGGDPADFLYKHHNIIDYIHLKDCKANVNDLVGYDRHLALCGLGDGAVDLHKIIDILFEQQYEGLVTLEVDSIEKTPKEVFLANTRYVTQELGLSLTS
jgi:inosose dehydratase